MLPTKFRTKTFIQLRGIASIRGSIIQVQVYENPISHAPLAAKLKVSLTFSHQRRGSTPSLPCFTSAAGASFRQKSGSVLFCYCWFVITKIIHSSSPIVVHLLLLFGCAIITQGRITINLRVKVWRQRFGLWTVLVETQEERGSRSILIGV